MKLMKPLFCFLLLISSAHTAMAQLSADSRIYDANFGVNIGEQDVSMLLQPGIHFLLSRRFALGAQLQVNGSFTEGLQLVLAEPEMRFYLSPNQPKSNWFIFTGTRFNIYDKMDLNVPFQLKAGVGVHTRFAEGITWQSRLFVTLQSGEFESFFERPDFYFDNKLVYFQPPQRRHSRFEIIPSVGRGKWMIGGSSLGLNRESQFGIRAFNVQAIPGIGHFFFNRLLAGLRLPFNYTRIRTDFLFFPFDQNVRVEQMSWGISPFVRYYPARLGNTLQPFAETRLTLNYTRSSQRQPGIPPQFTHLHSTEVLLGGGIDLFLTGNVAFETAISVGKNLDQDFTTIQLEAGFQYFIGRR